MGTPPAKAFDASNVDDATSNFLVAPYLQKPRFCSDNQEFDQEIILHSIFCQASAHFGSETTTCHRKERKEMMTMNNPRRNRGKRTGQRQLVISKYNRRPQDLTNQNKIVCVQSCAVKQQYELCLQVWKVSPAR